MRTLRPGEGGAWRPCLAGRWCLGVGQRSLRRWLRGARARDRGSARWPATRMEAPLKSCPECKREYEGPERFCPHDGMKLVERERLPEDPLIGTILQDRYAVRSLVGQGPTGKVYLVEHTMLGNRHALKLLRRDLTRDEGRLMLFRRHAALAARIDADNILAVNDFGQTAEGSQYILMALAEGSTLAQLLAQQARLPLDVALAIAIQIAAILDRTHGQSIVHGGLKPTNVFLLPQRRGPRSMVVL
ncbi:MAG: hypothetical protein FJ125_14795, partial [Deltaproteobacteria bacterium]|nr:hypothetical protein [Deltaproteobacteria bacterium]